MYCVKCGVKLADTEQKCPLCYTRVCHPDILQPSAQPLYPSGKMPGQSAGRQAAGGLVLFLFLIPLLLCLCGDLQPDGKLDLTLREKAYIQMDADAAKLLEILESYAGVLPFSEKASPEVIKRETGLSKNAFKRAVGHLYKQRVVDITDGKIRLTK